MREIYVDLEKRTIVMTKKFAVAASNPLSGEWKILQEVRSAYPEFEVKRHTIKKQPNKECYKGLTYDYMRNYIMTYDENAMEVLNELEHQIVISRCHSSNVRYSTIKKWFLNKYPEIKNFGTQRNAETDFVLTAEKEMENVA